MRISAMRHAVIADPRHARSLYTSMVFFLGMIKDNGKTRLEDITKGDVEAFIEREQDRGIKITTIERDWRTSCLFYGIGWKRGSFHPRYFFGGSGCRCRSGCPGLWSPTMCQRLLSVIDQTRDRAMILALLRTGMLGIGELLSTKMSDIHLKERRIEDPRGGEESFRQSGVSQRRCHLRFGILVS